MKRISKRQSDAKVLRFTQSLTPNRIPERTSPDENVMVLTESVSMRETCPLAGMQQVMP